MLWRARERVARVLGNALNSRPNHDVLTMWRSASPRHGSMPELLLSGASRELRATNPASSRVSGPGSAHRGKNTHDGDPYRARRSPGPTDRTGPGLWLAR